MKCNFNILAYYSGFILYDSLLYQKYCVFSPNANEPVLLISFFQHFTSTLFSHTAVI